MLHRDPEVLEVTKFIRTALIGGYREAVGLLVTS